MKGSILCGSQCHLCTACALMRQAVCTDNSGVICAYCLLRVAGFGACSSHPSSSLAHARIDPVRLQPLCRPDAVTLEPIASGSGVTMDAPAQRARRLLQEVFGRFPGQLNPAFVSNQKLMAFTGFSNFQGKQQEAITAVLSGQGGCCLALVWIACLTCHIKHRRQLNLRDFFQDGMSLC